jgi:hypothetical protein
MRQASCRRANDSKSAPSSSPSIHTDKTSTQNGAAFEDALKQLNDKRILPSEPRRIRVQRSTAKRHFNVVRRSDQTTPTPDEVWNALKHFGQLEATISKTHQGSVQVRFECYGCFLEAQRCVLKRGSCFTLVSGSARHEDGDDNGNMPSLEEN